MSSVIKIIFDLDGTLVDSAPSLCKAGNFMLGKLGRPPIDVQTYKTFIGKGLLKQVEQLLLHTGGVPENNLNKQFETFHTFYESDTFSSTTVYDGVYSCLDALVRLPSKLSICTQKTQKPARKVLSHFDLEKYFEGFSFGDSLSVMKPDPAMVFQSTRGFGDGPIIYVGDSETDSITAKNANAVFLLFSGGYRNSRIDEINNYAVFDNHSEIVGLVQEILSEVR